MTEITPSDPGAAFRLLVVEDNPADARLLTEVLRERGIETRTATTLGEAAARLACDDLDLVLLDLGLADSDGIDSLRRLLADAGERPVVVMTGAGDDALGIQALAAGAEDFISKDLLADGGVVGRALRFALERWRLRGQLRTAEEALERDREARALGRIGVPRTAVAAAALGVLPLREVDLVLFAEIKERYAAILKAAAESRLYQVDHPTSDELRGLADRLGFLRAGPRDVVELHQGALRELVAEAGIGTGRLLNSEGRIIVLELMGYLVSYYRRYYVASMGVS